MKKKGLKKLFNKKVLVYGLLLIISVVLLLTTLYLNRQKATYKADTVQPPATVSFSQTNSGDNYTININIEPNENSVCAFYPDMTFTNSKFTVISISKGNSSLANGIGTLTEPSSANKDGVIKYGVGVYGCTTSAFTAITITGNAIDSNRGDIQFKITKKETGTLFGGPEGMDILTLSNEEPTLTFSTVLPPSPPADDGGSSAGDTSSSSSSSSTTTTKNKTVAPKTPTITAPQPAATTASTAAVTVQAPVILEVKYTDSSSLDSSQKKAKGIEFSGSSDPSAKINITITSDPITVTATADATGKWTYILDSWLVDGNHKIAVVAEKDGIKSTETSANFYFDSANKSKIGLGVKPATTTATTTTTTEKGLNTRLYLIIAAGVLILAVAALFLSFYIKRRKYLFTIRDVRNQVSSNQNNIPMEKNPEENKEEEKTIEKISDVDMTKNQNTAIDQETLDKIAQTPSTEEPAENDNGELKEQNIDTEQSDQSKAEPTEQNINTEGSLNIKQDEQDEVESNEQNINIEQDDRNKTESNEQNVNTGQNDQRKIESNPNPYASKESSDESFDYHPNFSSPDKDKENKV